MLYPPGISGHINIHAVFLGSVGAIASSKSLTWPSVAEGNPIELGSSRRPNWTEAVLEEARQHGSVQLDVAILRWIVGTTAYHDDGPEIRDVNGIVERGRR